PKDLTPVQHVDRNGQVQKVEFPEKFTAYRMPKSGVEMPKEWPIGTDAIEPPVAEGHFRMYRGVQLDHPGHVREFSDPVAKSYSMDRELALGYAGPNGKLLYVDVPESVYSKYELKNTLFHNYIADFPPEVHAGARESVFSPTNINRDGKN